MNTPRVVRSLAASLAVALALFSGSPATADEVDDFQRDVEAALDAVGSASEEVLAAGLDGSSAHLLEAVLDASDAILLQASLLTAAQTAPLTTALGKQRLPVTKALAGFTRATTKALSQLVAANGTSDISAKTLKSALTKLKAANKAGLGLTKKLTKLPKPGFTLTELGKSAGFHKPGSLATFKLTQNPFGPPCAGPFTVTVTDQFGAPVTQDPHTFQVTDPSRPFTVRLGTAGGSARVKIAGCDASSERLLFNYGAFGKINTAFRLLPKELPFGSVSDFGLPYLEYVDAVGGTDPCVWTATGLPVGFTLQTVSSGSAITCDTVGISGFPWVNPQVVGDFSVRITGTDARGRVTVRDYSLTILP